MTETEKMLAGKLYDPSDPMLAKLRAQAHKLCRQFNNTDEDEEQERKAILKQLLPHMGDGTFLQGPIQFDYGSYTTIGENCYANFNLTVLDCCPVSIGNNVFFGPNCSLMTPMHPLLPAERNMRRRENGELYNQEYARPIVIEGDCWIAANVVICGGVTIGRGCVIGAGSVVTRNLPPNSLAAGNPCRVLRSITEADSVAHKRELWEQPCGGLVPPPPQMH